MDTAAQNNPRNDTGEPRHLPYLDGWRGIAILLVLSHHFAGVPASIGILGVYFFFVLSGLLISRILFVDKMPLGKFYLRRIARIFPVYYLYIIGVTVWSYTYMPPYVEGEHVYPWEYYHQYYITDDEFIYSALFLRTYYPILNIWNAYLPIGHIWSLAVEEHCYVLLSLVSLLAMRRHENVARYAVTAAALACIGFAFYYSIAPPDTLTPVYLRSEYAGFGILISGSILLWLRRCRRRIPGWVPLLSVLGGIIAGTAFRPDALAYFLSPLLLGLAVNTLHAAPPLYLRLLSNRVLVWFGLCSFSIYMWQQPFYFMTQCKYWQYGFASAFLAALIASTVSYYGYERPMRKWIRGLGKCKMPRFLRPGFWKARETASCRRDES